jgi:hypothetical protein
MTRLLQKLTGGYGFESAGQAARTLLARYDTDHNGVLDKAELGALQAELAKCISQPFFVFLTSPIMQPGALMVAGVMARDRGRGGLSACAHLCVRVGVRVGVRVCVRLYVLRVCVWVCVWVCVCVCVCTCCVCVCVLRVREWKAAFPACTPLLTLTPPPSPLHCHTYSARRGYLSRHVCRRLPDGGCHPGP